MFKLDLSNISPSNFVCVPRYIYDTLQWLMPYFYCSLKRYHWQLVKKPPGNFPSYCCCKI